MKTKHLFLSIGLVFLGICFPLATVHAVSCTTAQSGNIAIGSSCTFDGTYDGAVGGNITVAAGTTLTILAGQNIVVNQGKSFDVTASGAKIVIVDTGAMLVGRTICLTDADGDTYPASLAASNQTLTATTCPAGKIARNTAIWQADCNDGNASYFAALTCYPNADGDAAYSTTPHSVCAGSTCASIGESATVGTDCNDSSNTQTANIQCYPDADADGYYAKTLGAAFCGSTCAAAGQSATIGTDCCDTSNATHPGQTSFSTSANACGSYDYNCDGTAQLGDTTTWGGCGTCTVDNAGQKCSAVGGGNGGFDGVPACGQVGTYRGGGGCDEMATYPSNCFTATCWANYPTQSCL